MKDPIAVYGLTNNATVQIMECDGDYVTYVDPLMKWHRAKIYVDTARPYFRYCGGFRIHLDECMK